MTELTPLIIDCLRTSYQIDVDTLVMLPIGADVDSLVYKVQSIDQKVYFIKLKRGHSLDVNIAVLELLHKEGVQQLILPIKTVNGGQAQRLGNFTLIVYPYIHGENGFTHILNDPQWIGLGRALKRVHEVNVPTSLQAKIRREKFSPKWRDSLRALYAQIKSLPAYDEIALSLWNYLQENRSTIQQLVECAEHLCQKALHRPLQYVLCHSDIHGGNILVDDKNALYIVDWDEPIMAPKERDLMFIGGGVGNVWNDPHEEKLFYHGYGQTDVDLTLLAYYRFERIVEDIAIYSRELLLEPTGSKNRVEMYQHFTDQFAPRGVVDIAFKTVR